MSIQAILTMIAALPKDMREELAKAFSPEGLARVLAAPPAPDPIPPATMKVAPVVRPASGPADPREIAREIVKSILRDGRVWARRQWLTPKLCAWAGHLVTDRKGTNLFVLSCVQEDADALLCKKVREDGTVYGQSVLRSVDREIARDLGPFVGVKADMTVLDTPAPAPAPAKVAAAPTPAPAPVVNHVPEGQSGKATPATSNGAIVVPNGATHLIVVQPDGEPARYSGTGEIMRLDLRGHAARSIVAGLHPRWSARIATRGFGVRFEGVECPDCNK